MLPVWLAAGFADYLGHRTTSIGLSRAGIDVAARAPELQERIAVPRRRSVFRQMKTRQIRG